MQADSDPADSDPRLDVLSLMHTPIWIFDVHQAKILWANSVAVLFWNAVSAEALYARNLATDMSASVRSRLSQILNDCKSTEGEIAEHWTLYPEGVPVTSELIFNEIRFDNQSALLIHALSESTSPTSYTLHSAQALMHTSAMISLYDADHELVYSNPAARKITHSTSQSLAEKFVDRAQLSYVKRELNLRGHCSIEAEVNTVSGKVWHSMDVEVSPDAITGERSILVSATDVTERRRAQLEAYMLAYTDSLTGLPNRAALIEGIERSIEKCEGSNDNLAIVFLDLNRFKLINDSLGHRVGDGLLIEIARRLKSLVGDRGIVGRLGGDEFVILLKIFHSRKELESLIDNMSKRIADPTIVDGHHLQVDSSAGICCYPEHGQDTTELLKNADVAMYTAKYQNLKFTFFDASMEEGIRNRLVLEQDLTQAIKNDDFVVYYQPKICAASSLVTGVEALIRWMHPEKGMISPFDFIPIAEETGQIIPIGNWIMQEAMKQQKDWAAAGLDLVVSINISPKQFQQEKLAAEVSNALAITGCDPSHVELEITESMLLGDTQSVYDTLDELTRMGVRLAIDDFGTGFSNLAYLQKYPLHSLKIDRVFLVEKDRRSVLEMIIKIGKVLGLCVVAEGVETLEEVEWLTAHDCDELQGYFFSYPLPAEELTRYLQQYQPLPAGSIGTECVA